MVDELNFIDLACLLKITPDSTIENLGTTINASIFDAGNIAGSLKQKALIDFSSYYPGPTTIVVSDAGKALIAEAESKAKEPLDHLDDEILFQVSGGKRLPIEIQNTLNIRSKDLALHLYKLFKQGLLIYELKSGGAEIQLTESGFLKAKAGQAAPAVQPAAAPKPVPQAQVPPQMQNAAAAPQGQQATASTQQFEPKMDEQIKIKPKNNNALYMYVVIVLVVLAILYYVIEVKKIL